jgi:hypothetical protein
VTEIANGRNLEKRIPSAEIEDLTKLEGESIDDAPPPRRRGSLLPMEVRKHCVKISKLPPELRADFEADPKLKDRAARYLRVLWPPRSRGPGRPPLPGVTKAIRLLHEFRRQYPEEKNSQLWNRIFPLALPGYETLTADEKRRQGKELKDRVRSRENQQRRRRRQSKRQSP